MLEERKAEIKFRTDRTKAAFGGPQLSASPVVYEVAEKTRAVTHGGIPLIHQIAVQCGLIERLNEVRNELSTGDLSQNDISAKGTKSVVAGGLNFAR